MKPLSETKLNTRWDAYKKYLQNVANGLQTGVPCLDQYLLGLGNLVSIQGETSSCKSSFALQIIHHNLQQGMPCLLIDKENGEGRIITRLLCQATNLSQKELMEASIEDKQEFINRVNAYPLHIHTEPITKQEHLELKVKELWNTYKKPFTLLFDSIQASDKMEADQRVSLERWVYFLDKLKLDYAGKLTIILVSEKNRSSYGFQGIGGGKGSNVVDYKPETVLDIRYDEIQDRFYVKVSKHRDGLRGAMFELKKKYSVKNDNRSFCFLLEESEIESETAAI